MARERIIGSLLTLLTLFIGMGIGFFVGISTSEVKAQTNYQVNPQAQVGVQAEAKVDIEEVRPTMTVGSAAIGTLLANRIAADQVMIHGFDLIKLHEGVLNILKTKNLASYREVDAIVEGAKVRPLRAVIPTSANKQEQPK